MNGIHVRDLEPNELLNFNVVLSDEIDCILLLVDTSCAHALDRVQASTPTFCASSVVNTRMSCSCAGLSGPDMKRLREHCA